MEERLMRRMIHAIGLDHGKQFKHVYEAYRNGSYYNEPVALTRGQARCEAGNGPLSPAIISPATLPSMSLPSNILYPARANIVYQPPPNIVYPRATLLRERLQGRLGINI